MSDKQIQEWQEKVRNSFGDEAKLYQYLFETMDNFYYRYLETSQNSDMKTQNFGAHLWGAKSTETSMVNALKISHAEAKKGIIELAKSVPGGKGVAVQYELMADVKELTIDHGMIKFTSTINWDFPDFTDPSKKIGKSITFKYEDLAQFRKELALKLEDVCTLFL